MQNNSDASKLSLTFVGQGTYISEPGHENTVVLHIGGHTSEIGILRGFLVLKIPDEVTLLGLEKINRTKLTDTLNIAPG